MTAFRVIAFLAALLWAAAAGAQTSDDEGTRLERLIESSLSGAGRDVTVRGFRGLLSGRAEMESLTIADADGVWLTLDDAVLDWTRLALLRGRLEVSELSAARIEVARPPVPGPPDPIAPEASGTALAVPELPVAVRIGSLSAEELVLGETVLGQPLTATVSGAVQLEEGEVDATVSLERSDQKRGEFSLEVTASNSAGELSIDVVFDEDEDGVAAGLLQLPGAPAVRLAATGEGPLDAFAATIELATDGTERLGGTVETVSDESGRRFDVDLEGDLRPLVEEQYRAFFGSSTAIQASALRRADGATELSRLTIGTSTLALNGSAVVGPNGVPELISVEGTLAAPDGDALLLPLTGPETRLDRADLEIDFDAARGDGWRARVEVAGLNREGFSANRVALAGDGTIKAAPVAVTARFDFAAEALDFGANAAQDAIGETVEGLAEIAWSQDAPVEIAALEVRGETYIATASGTIANVGTTLDLDGAIAFEVEDLAVFAGLANRPLSGSANASLTGQASVHSGLVDVRGAISGDSIQTGEPRVDPYLTGGTAIDFAVRRTTEGLFLDTLSVAGSEVEALAAGELRTGSGTLDVSASLGEIGPLLDGLAGPAGVALDADMDGGVWTWALDADAMETALIAQGTLADPFERPIVTAAGEVVARDLSAFADLAKRDLAGSSAIVFSTRAEPTSRRVSIDAEGRLQNIRTGLDPVDRALGVLSEIALSGSVDGERFDLGRLSLESETVSLEASGAFGTGLDDLALSAQADFPDVGTVLEGVSGPGSLRVELVPEGETGPWNFEVAANAPATRVAAEGVLSNLSDAPEASGSLSLQVDDLAPYGAIAGLSLGGSIDFSAEGNARADLSAFDVTASGTALNARTGIAAVDTIFAGRSSLRLDANRTENAIVVDAASVETPLLSASASGALGREAAFGFRGSLADIAALVPGFSGPVTAEGRVEAAGGERAGVDAEIIGPAGARATVSGTVADNGQTANLAIRGATPLGLVNGVIAPRAADGTASFDLAVNGPFDLASVSGRVTTSGARVTGPALDLTLEDIAGTATLSSGRVTTDLRGALATGGRAQIGGTIDLRPGLPADLDIALTNAVLTDPTLFETQLNAGIDVTGQLAGQGNISGRVDIGETELRIPSTLGGGGGGLPDITHIDEPAASFETRRRAGLVETGREGSEEGGANFDLDVLINAPNRIFIRGRGLEAELGGSIRIGGSTRNIAPVGRFDLIRGRLDIAGRRLDLTRGDIQLVGDLIPILRLVAETQVDGTTILVVVEGPADDPEFTFESQPSLPEDEVLALLIFGRSVDALSPLQIARLAGAVTTLQGSGGGLLGGIREGAGLADLDITTAGDGGAALSAGAYISDNIYTDVTIGTDGEAVLNLNLDLSQSVTARGSASSDGESGFGVVFERDY